MICSVFFFLNFVHLNRNLEPSYSFIFQLNRKGLDAVLLKIILNKIILMRGPRSKARVVLEKRKKEIKRQSCDEMLTYCRSRRTDPAPFSPPTLLLST